MKRKLAFEEEDNDSTSLPKRTRDERSGVLDAAQALTDALHDSVVEDESEDDEEFQEQGEKYRSTEARDCYDEQGALAYQEDGQIMKTGEEDSDQEDLGDEEEGSTPIKTEIVDGDASDQSLQDIYSDPKWEEHSHSNGAEGGVEDQGSLTEEDVHIIESLQNSTTCFVHSQIREAYPFLPTSALDRIKETCSAAIGKGFTQGRQAMQVSKARINIFKLPLHVRKSIYSFTLADLPREICIQPVLIRGEFWGLRTLGSPKISALMSVSTQVRAEALEVYFESRTFTIYACHWLYLCLEPLEPEDVWSSDKEHWRDWDLRPHPFRLPGRDDLDLCSDDGFQNDQYLDHMERIDYLDMPLAEYMDILRAMNPFPRVQSWFQAFGRSKASQIVSLEIRLPLLFCVDLSKLPFRKCTPHTAVLQKRISKAHFEEEFSTRARRVWVFLDLQQYGIQDSSAKVIALDDTGEVNEDLPTYSRTP